MNYMKQNQNKTVLQTISASKLVIGSIIVFIAFIIIDLFNIPSLIGIKTTNMNWDLCLGLFDLWIVVLLFLITYKKIDARNIERENNKRDISSLLIASCYAECQNYLNLLTQETIEKYIIPKVDFNSTSNKVVTNLQEAPFTNENIIMDLAKDGQLSKIQIDGYFNIKNKYRIYITNRITFFDAPEIYNPLLVDLNEAIKREIAAVKSKK